MRGFPPGSFVNAIKALGLVFVLCIAGIPPPAAAQALPCSDAIHRTVIFVATGKDCNPAPPPEPPNPGPPCTTECVLPEPRPEPTWEPWPDVRMVEQSDPELGSTAPRDWDSDGIPDMLDSVNLPSESKNQSASGDFLLLPQGVLTPGFAFLMEPSHREAFLVVAETTPGPPDTLTAPAALDLIGQRYDERLRGAFAQLIHENVTIHHVPVAPAAPASLDLAWDIGTIPVDGSWILFRVSPTDQAQLTLGGTEIELAAPAASRLALQGEQQFRWEFINRHRNTTFCFDATVGFPGAPCSGHASDGWLRTFSGEAAFALEAAASGLAAGLWPVSHAVDASALEPILEGVLENATSLQQTDASSQSESWHPLGPSQQFQPGYGIDYRLISDAVASGPSLVRPLGNPSGRLFRFESYLNVVPMTNARNLSSFHLGISPLDGIHDRETFVLDGAALSEVLDPLPGEGWVVQLDDNDLEGFRWMSEDVSGDGTDDIVVDIPHFSEKWLTVSTSNNPPVDFYEVAMDGPTTGWLTGGLGKVYRYQSGSLTAVSIPGFSSQRTLGLHVISDMEIWVTGEGLASGTQNQQVPFIAHYVAPSWIDTWRAPYPSFAGGVLHDIWVNGAKTEGYAVGENGLYFKRSGADWVAQTHFTQCSIEDLRLDAQGNGFAAIWVTDGCDAKGLAGVVKFDSGVVTNFASGDVWEMQDLDSASPSLAVGRGLAYRSSVFQYNDGGVPDTTYYGVARVPTKTVSFLVGKGPDGAGAGIVRYVGNGGAFVRTLPGASTRFHDIAFSSPLYGLAVGGPNLVFQFSGNNPPTEASTISRTTGTSLTTFTGTDAGSSDPDSGDTLTHEWNWGDATVTSGATATHRYDVVGTFTVTHRVTDNWGDSASRNFNVIISPLTLAPGTPASNSFSSGSAAETHQYRVAATGVARALEIQVSGTGLLLSSSLDLYPYAAAWPVAGAVGTTLTGLVPAGKDLFVAVKRPAGVATTSYVLQARLVPPPSPPVLVSVPPNAEAGQATAIYVTLPHPDSRPTAALVSWSAGAAEEQVPSGNHFESPTAERSLFHTYPSTGTYSITMRTVDDLGQVSSSTSTSLVVLNLPAGSALGAKSVSYTSATLQGAVTSLGGASSVDVHFVVYRSGAVIVTTPTQTMTATGTVPEQSVSGLLDGRWYQYSLVLTNPVGTESSQNSSFTTSTWIAVKPSVVTSTLSVPLGTSASLGLKGDSASIYDVAYWVEWGDQGAPRRYPSSGFVPWTQTVTADYLYPFPGAYTAQIRLEDSSGKYSNAVSRAATVTGAAPIASGFPALMEAQYDRVVLGNKPANLVYPSDTDFRILFYSPLTRSWTPSPWFDDVQAGQQYTWTTPPMYRGYTYSAKVEYRVNNAGTWTQGTAFSFKTNQRPVLTEQTPSTQHSSMEAVTLKVSYSDPDGDPPREAAGNLASPTVTLNEASYPMYSTLGRDPTPGDYKAGVTFEYRFASLPPGTLVRPLYAARDAYQAASSVYGQYQWVRERDMLSLNFEQDTDGASPSRMVTSPDDTNLWHVADSARPGFPDRIALGAYGKVLWFGHPTRGTYEDPDGGVSFGYVETQTIWLGDVMNPRLSFSTFFETETAPGHDVKKVSILDSSGTTLSERTLTMNNGGYGAWKTFRWDLSSWGNRYVKVRFTFDAVDNQYNDRLGWLIDNIVIGNDEDQDGSPDALEDARALVLLSSNALPLPVAPGSNARVELHRLNRAYSDHLVLDAVVGSAAPDTIKVTVGVPGTAGVVVWNQGAVSEYCDTPGIPGWQPNWGTPVAHREPDGVRLSVDVRICNALFRDAFVPASDWWVEVRDFDFWDLKQATIEYARITDWSRTGPYQPDTELDGLADGAEGSSSRDPMGLDLDQDGIAESLDMQDQTPNHVPALSLESTDWTHGMLFRFDDSRSTLPTVSFCGSLASAQCDPLSSVEQHAGVWKVIWDTVPYEVVAAVTDPFGANSAVHLSMGAGPGGVQPVNLRVAVENWNPETENTEAVLDWSRPIPPPANGRVDQLVVHEYDPVAIALGRATADEALGDWAHERLGGTVRGAGYRYLSSLALTVFVDGLIDDYVFGCVDEPGAQVVCEPSQAASADGFAANYHIPATLLADACQKGFDSVSGCDRAMRSAIGQASLSVQVGPVVRWFRQDPEVPTRVAVIETLGWRVLDAWQWTLPARWDQWEAAAGPGITNLLALETIAMDKVLQDPNRSDWELTYCWTYCRFAESLAAAIGFTTSETDGTSHVVKNTQLEAPLRVPIEFGARTGAAHRAYSKAQEWFDPTVTEYVVGMMGLEHASQRAKAASGGSNIFWFWDDSTTITSPTPCTGPNPPVVRRCQDFLAQGSVASSTWMTQSVGTEKMWSFGADWYQTSVPSNVFHRDAVTAKGLVTVDQPRPFPNGRPVVDAVLETMNSKRATNPILSRDADVLVAYDWTGFDTVGLGTTGLRINYVPT